MTKKKSSKNNNRYTWEKHSLLCPPKPHYLAFCLYNHTRVYVGEADIQNARYCTLGSGLLISSFYQLYSDKYPMLYVSDVRYYNSNQAIVSVIGGDKNLIWIEKKNQKYLPELIFLPSNNILANKNVYIHAPSYSFGNDTVYMDLFDHAVDTRQIEAIISLCGGTIKKKYDKTIDIFVHDNITADTNFAKSLKKVREGKNPLSIYTMSSLFAFLKQKLLEKGY